MDIQRVEGISNYQSRGGIKPFVIANHISAGTLGGMTNWFKKPESKASSNFGIGRDGTILQYVDIEKAAWTQGIDLSNISRATAQVIKDMGCNPNLYIVSIEHEGYLQGGLDENGEVITENFGLDGALTDIQFAASCWLHRYIMDYLNNVYGVNMGLGEYNVIGHFQVDPVRKPLCPGLNFPWPKMREEFAIAQLMTLKDYESRLAMRSQPEILNIGFRAANQHVYVYTEYKRDPVANKWMEPYLLKMHEITKEYGMYFE